MAESQYTAPATYTITFPSLSQAEVKVSVNGAELSTSNYSISGYATSGSGTVTITSTVNTGDIVRIYRDTDIASPEATFAAGASIKAADLNNNNQQLRYKLEEKIDESNIATQAVVTDALRDLNVTTEKIANLSVINSKIGPDAVTNDKIADNAIAIEQMQDNSVDTPELVDAAVTTAKLEDNSVTTPKIVDANVVTSKIADSNVTTAKIADSNVTTAKIADSNVTTAKIADSNVTTAKIADSNVTTAKIADANVTNAKLADDSVSTAKVLDNAITEPKLANNSVTNRQIADGSIDGAKLTNGTLDVDKIKGLDIVTTAEQNAGSPTWTGVDDTLASIGAIERRHDVLYQNSTPSGTDWAIGKLWYAHGSDQTLSVWSGSNWIGISSGGTFITQPTVIWVDQANGDDSNDGHRIIDSMKTIKAAVTSADAGDIVLVAPGVYREAAPIDVTVNNLSIIGQSLRSCFVHPTPATEESVLFRVNSGTQIANFSMAGMKASGTRGGHAVDNDSTYGLPTNQGWAISFYPNSVIYKSPYIQNCTTFMDSGIYNHTQAEYNANNSLGGFFDPNNVNQGGFGGDRTSSPTGGGLFINGDDVSSSSPLRSMVVDSFTQINLDGPGALVCNNAYAQFVSFFGTFTHYHCKSLNGGRVNLSNCTTDYGRYGLIADGKSTSALYSSTVKVNASAGGLYVDINKAAIPTGWFGSGIFATRPTDDMLMQVTSTGGTDLYALTGSDILNSSGNVDNTITAESDIGGYRVHVIRTASANRSTNLGLINATQATDPVSFFFRSYISSGGHTFEYVGAGTDYDAAPENGGQPVETNRTVERNNGAVWQSSTDHNGKFTVGNFMVVDQKSGLCEINNINGLAFPTSDGSANNVLSTNGSGTLTWQSISALGGSGISNLNEDTSPQLGGDLDVVTYDIVSTSNRDIDLDPNGSGNVVIKGNSTRGSGAIQLNCENNSHGIKVQGPPHSAGANYTLTLPNDTGTNGQALVTNGSGTTSWSTIDLSTRLALSGGTMTGALTLSGAPTANLHAATKAYADTMLPLAGGTMTGAITLSGAPTANLHAATKQYVDDATLDIGNLPTLP
jgi:uncharacterized protein YjbI with pentapeptide repeats